jgi:hypothetical protein
MEHEFLLLVPILLRILAHTVLDVIVDDETKLQSPRKEKMLTPHEAGARETIPNGGCLLSAGKSYGETVPYAW